MANQNGTSSLRDQAEPAPGARVSGRAQVSGMNGRGVVHFAGAVGMLGTPRRHQAPASHPGDEDSLDMNLQGKRGGPPAGPHPSGQ